ncbi:telomere length regulation protein [Sporothrix stenoceras]|uniref:Small ribosomal subunit protein mS41 n=1 Tax=Sporothrix stenoceras TaxID=5173 RepID=A0ABR3ZSD0_9PEZI
MNSLRRLQPAPLGRVLAAAPSSLWAAFAVGTTKAARTATPTYYQPRQLAQPFSSTSSLLSTGFSFDTNNQHPPVFVHSVYKPKTVPDPIPLVPDVKTFLTIIGRNMKQHAPKFPSWEALFTLSSKQLRRLGVENTSDRRYLLRWLQRFREGRFGPGGDFAFVRNGVAELRVVKIADPEDPIKVHKFVINIPAPETPAAAEGEEVAEGAEGAEGEAQAEAAAESATAAEAEHFDENNFDLTSPHVRVRGYKPVGARFIKGPYALPRRVGSHVTVVEGMWEDKLGRKIDGGERRQAEVRFRRRVAERRAAREALMHASGIA